MKNITIFMLAIALLTPLSITFAQTPNTTEAVQSSPSRQNLLRERLEQQRLNYRQNLQEARAIAEKYRSAETEADRNTLRQQTRNGFLVRLTNVVDRMVQMQERVEARISAARTRGLDVSQAMLYLRESQTATQQVLDHQEKLETILNNNTDPANKEMREEAQAIFELIKTDFAAARKGLMLSITSLQSVTNQENSITDRVMEAETVTETIEDENLN